MGAPDDGHLLVVSERAGSTDEDEVARLQALVADADPSFTA